MNENRNEGNLRAGIAQLEEHLICNGAFSGAADRRNAEPAATPATVSATRYYLEPWGKSWRIIDIRRGWGHGDAVCVCTHYDDALLIFGLLNGGRG